MVASGRQRRNHCVKLSSCGRLDSAPHSGTWYRAIELQFSKAPLRCGHTKTYPGRFTPGNLSSASFSMLYLAEHQALCLHEVEAIYRGRQNAMIPNPSRPWAIINVDVRLSSVVDLTAPESQKLLQTSVQELTGDWAFYNSTRTLAPTQKLGVALANVSGVEGFFAPSAKSPDERTLNIFPGKLTKGSFVTFRNPITSKLHSIRGR